MTASRAMRFLLLFCFISALSSCGLWDALFGETPSRRPARSITATGSGATEKSANAPVASSSPTPVDKACIPLLEVFDPGVKTLDEKRSAPFFEIQFKTALKEDDIARKVLDFADVAYGQGGCTDPKLEFRASSNEGIYFEGGLSQTDYELYRQGRISRAELARRFDLKKLETLASVKLKIKTARDGGDDGYAATLVQQWLEKEPGNLTAKLIQADVELDQEKYQEAAILYEEVLLVQPKNFTAWFNLAFAKKEMGAFDEAVAIFRKLAADYGEFEYRSVSVDDILLHLTDALVGSGRLDEAEVVVGGFPGEMTDAWIILDVNLKRAQKRYAEAKKILEEFLKSHPDSEVGRFNFVLLHLDLQDRDGARKEYEALKTLNPEAAEELKFLPIFAVKPATTEPPKEGT